MHKLTSVSTGLLALFMGFISSGHAASVEDRLDRLEKMMGNQVLMEQVQQMQLIQQELTELRELVEGQEHQLTLIKQRQRNLYQDMDRRLQDLEAGSVRVPAGNGTVPGIPGSSVPPPVVPGEAGPTKPGSEAAPLTDESNTDTDGKEVYNQAFNILKDGDYPKAIKQFQSFMTSYPDSRYAVNGQYWLGEAYYASRDYKSALGVFQAIVEKHSESSKALDAELKIGYTYYAMKDWKAAREALEGLIKKHPDATRSVEKARKRLDRMKREGR
ncbi:MAG: tol-pal system protein YbgF [Gammaproteobacteria bacterium]|nr:tol-pal system protein YbgF [Gammaproteobacteria bacterium]